MKKMEKIPIKQYSFKLIIFSIIVVLLTVGVQMLFPNYATPALPYIVLFFFLMTLFTLFIVLRSKEYKEKQRFVSSYFLSRTIKFLSCLIFLVVYILLKPEDGWRFAISFMIIYFLYSFFEVYALKKENEVLAKKKDEKKETD